MGPLKVALLDAGANQSSDAVCRQCPAGSFSNTTGKTVQRTEVTVVGPCVPMDSFVLDHGCPSWQAPQHALSADLGYTRTQLVHELTLSFLYETGVQEFRH